MGTGLSKQMDEVGLRHFELQRVVGKGAFGKVRIVVKRDTRTAYALKYIDKMQCIRMRAIQNVFRERAILETLNHPYIVNLNYAFQDDQNLFFVLDLKTGGDLRHHLNTRLGFDEDVVRIWAAELSSALHYLHHKNIIHRDVKPDNILLDERGHAHLTDFNIAVSIDNTSVLKSKSGTLAYLAPEVFSGSGYYWQVDWWSLGVTLFELVYYKRPFRGKTTAHMIQLIRDFDPIFPKTNVFSRTAPNQEISPECVEFLKALMTRDLNERLGCGRRQILDVREHVWLKGVDWGKIDGKNFESLFVPNVTDENFDPRINLEEFLLDGFPLEPTPRQKKKKSSGTGNKKPTSSSPGNGGNSIMAYFSGPEAIAAPGKKSAADAAVVAGNTRAMLQEYNPPLSSSPAPPPSTKNIFSGAKKSFQSISTATVPVKERAKLTEGERVELELRYMKDQFLPFDCTKPKYLPEIAGKDQSNNARRSVPPPVPPIPVNIHALLATGPIVTDKSGGHKTAYQYNDDSSTAELFGDITNYVPDSNESIDAFWAKDEVIAFMASSNDDLGGGGIDATPSSGAASFIRNIAGLSVGSLNGSGGSVGGASWRKRKSGVVSELAFEKENALGAIMMATEGSPDFSSVVGVGGGVRSVAAAAESPDFGNTFSLKGYASPIAAHAKQDDSVGKSGGTVGLIVAAGKGVFGSVVGARKTFRVVNADDGCVEAKHGKQVEE